MSPEDVTLSVIAGIANFCYGALFLYTVPVSSAVSKRASAHLYSMRIAK